MESIREMGMDVSRPRWPAVMVTLGSLVSAARGVSQTPPIKSYGFDITIPDTGNAIYGMANLTLRSGTPDTLRLSLIGMSVDSVADAPTECCGSPIPFSYDGLVLNLVLTARAKALHRLSVFYHGAPQDGLIIRTNARGRRSVFADNWPERARYWLPTFDRPNGKAPVVFFVRVPSGWQVVSNGELLDRPDPSRRVSFWMWTESQPIPTYTMVLGAGDFTVSTHRPIIHGIDTIPITVWTYPEDSAFADSGPFRQATEIVETMERLVGPFPYEKLAHDRPPQRDPLSLAAAERLRPAL